MGGIGILKFTTYVENALCIYRNFCLFGDYARVFIITRIVVELLLIAAHFTVRVHHFYYHPKCKNQVLYFFLTSFNSAGLILSGCAYSESFEYLMTHLNAGCKFFDHDKNYLKRLRIQPAVLVSFLFVFCLTKYLIMTYTQTGTKYNPDLPPFWNYIFEGVMWISDIRYIYEFLVLYVVLHVMSEQLNVVTMSIGKEKVTRNNSQCLIMEVDKWSIIYRHIRESAKLFNHIFGLQLTGMLATAMIYYIIYLYAMALESVAGEFSLRDTAAYLSTLMLMLCILCMVARAAQRMENSADVLRRRLCKLLILSLSNDESYKVTKDLLRMMSTRPIRARAFGSISVDMTLLPTCVSIFTSYTVIALQFNNVL